jgi:hypothetical protein
MPPKSWSKGSRIEIGSHSAIARLLCCLRYSINGQQPEVSAIDLLVPVDGPL